MIGKLALDLIEHPLFTLPVLVPGGRRLVPQGAWEMLRSPAVLRGPGVIACVFSKFLLLNYLQKLRAPL